jgi:hypothetical protein
MNEKKNQINLELSEEIAEGVFSNQAMITHSPTEFVIDFVKSLPGFPKPKVKSRVILTPQHAKRLLAALNDNIRKYESVHGRIKDIEQLPLNYGNPKGEA